MKCWGRAGNPKIREHAHLLATMPDEEFAELVGCNPKYVYFLRRKRGLMCRRSGCLTGRTVDWERQDYLFGQKEDMEIAKSIGFSLETVKRRRQYLKVAPFFHPRKCPCGVEFQPKRIAHRYCSHACQGMNWYYLNVRRLSKKESLQEMFKYKTRKQEE